MIPIDPRTRPQRPRDMAEAAFYNAGVNDVLQLAQQAAEAVAAIDRRPIHEAFASAALNEFAERARAFLIYPHEGTGTVSLPETSAPPAGREARP